MAQTITELFKSMHDRKYKSDDVPKDAKKRRKFASDKARKLTALDRMTRSNSNG